MTNQPNPKAEAKTAEEILNKWTAIVENPAMVKNALLGAMHEYAESVHASRKEEWISVEDRLPELCNSTEIWDKGRSIECLCFYGGNAWFGRYWHTSQHWTINGIGGDSPKPEYWQPLPEPPTK